MTIGTAALTPEATWQEVDALVTLLTTLGIAHVSVTYGWGCQAEGIVQPVIVPLGDLDTMLHKNIAQGVFHLGDDNLYIAAEEPALTITLCHEADIHFAATDKSLEARVHDEWRSRGHRVWASKK